MKTDGKPKSKRGHNEKAVARFRLKQELVRIDREGNELDNTYSQRELIKALRDSGGMDSPLTFDSPPPPDNVTPITKGKKKEKPVAQSGNEAEAYDPGITEPAKHGGYVTGKSKPTYSAYPTKKPVVRTSESFMAPSGKPISDFLEGGRYPPIKKNPVVYPNGLLASEEFDETPVNDKVAVNDKDFGYEHRFKQIVSEVRGFINHVPFDDWPQQVVDLTTYRSECGNMPNIPAIQKLARTNKGMSSLLRATRDHVFDMLEDTAGTASIYKWEAGTLRDSNNKLSAKVEALESQVKALKNSNAYLAEQLESTSTSEPVHAVDKVRTDRASAHIQRLEERTAYLNGVVKDNLAEIKSLKQEVQALEYHYAMVSGDKESAAIIAAENGIKPKARPPEDADKLLSEVKLFTALIKSEGEARTYARYVYGDANLGDTIAQHANYLASNRSNIAKERVLMRRIGNNVKHAITTRYGNTGVAYPEVKHYRNKATTHKRLADIAKAEQAVFAFREREYATWWHKQTVAKPDGGYRMKRDREYYRLLEQHKRSEDLMFLRSRGVQPKAGTRKIVHKVNYQAVINKVVGVRSVSYSSPFLVTDYVTRDRDGNIQPIKRLEVMNPKLVNRIRRRMLWQESTAGTVIKAYNKVVSFLNLDVVDILNTEIGFRKKASLPSGVPVDVPTDAEVEAAARLAAEKALKAKAKAAYRIAH